MTSLAELPLRTIDGEVKTFGDYMGGPLLVVNVASKCGFTPQYSGLEAIYRSYKDRGFVVLGFPCDQFGHQEPGSDAEIKSFCELNYGVTFPLFAKIEVNGDGADPLYKFLKSQAGGILGEGIKWNFTKFLVGRDGEVLERFASVTTPSALESKVENALKA